VALGGEVCKRRTCRAPLEALCFAGHCLHHRNKSCRARGGRALWREVAARHSGTFTLGAISGQNAPISNLEKNVPIRSKQTYNKPGTPKPGTQVFSENPAQIARTISSDSVGIE